MKDRSRELRRAGRRRDSRVRRGVHNRLADEWSWNEGEVRRGQGRHKSVMHTLSEQNWRIRREGRNEVVAIEPGREYETPFDGPTAFWDAVEFAATELKKEK